MRTQIDVSANHGGYWEISICDSKEISQECFDRNKLLSCAPWQLALQFLCCDDINKLVLLRVLVSRSVQCGCCGSIGEVVL